LSLSIDVVTRVHPNETTDFWTCRVAHFGCSLIPTRLHDEKINCKTTLSPAQILHNCPKASLTAPSNLQFTGGKQRRHQHQQDQHQRWQPSCWQHRCRQQRQAWWWWERRSWTRQRSRSRREQQRSRWMQRSTSQPRWRSWKNQSVNHTMVSFWF
jgi:hypothetical protein